jgi:hypothetical protein
MHTLYMLSGLMVGFIVGLTGVGGGSLMTPILILLFGVHPATAVGTDLLYASATKAAGTAIHGFSGTVDWRVVGRLAMGSVPATAVTMHLLADTTAASQFITPMLAVALCGTAFLLIFRRHIEDRYAAQFERLGASGVRNLTILTGMLLGIFVSISSVGAGAMGVTALILLYPRIPVSRIVGSDIAHAVPLTLIAGIGHWAMGLSDLSVAGWLLTGSIPGIVAGSLIAPRIPDPLLRFILAGILLIAGGKLVF